jgi:hypothetical protein
MFSIRKFFTSLRIPIGIPQLALATLVFQNTFLILFMRYSRTVKGPLYASSTAVVSMEVVKFISCLTVLCFEDSSSTLPMTMNDEGNPSTQKSSCCSLYRLYYSLRIEFFSKPREIGELLSSFIHELDDLSMDMIRCSVVGGAIVIVYSPK